MPKKVFNGYLLWFSLVGAMLALCPTLRAQDVTSDPPCQVTIDSGTAQGAPRGQSCVYLGIPYAASPAGAGRWRPPMPVAPWIGVKSFTKFGNMCPQLLGDGITAVGNEDCLNVNVFSPSHQGPLPVLFMIHGSGNQKSSNRAEAGSSLDGQYFAEHGPAVVVVTNYRLGALGWLAHAALDAGDAAVVGWLAAHHLSTGLGTYTESNIITLDSGGRIAVRTVSWRLSGAIPRAFESEASWYDPWLNYANFIVTNSADSRGISAIPLGDILALAGAPAHTYHYKTFTIMVWNHNLLADLGTPPSSRPGNLR